MCTQKSRPVDAFQRIAASFKLFENKLDKLQEDVDYHGQTLSELRNMVTNLSGGAILAAVNKAEDSRGLPKKSSAMQYEIKIQNKSPVLRKQSLPQKAKVKNYQNQIKNYQNQMKGYQNQIKGYQTQIKGYQSPKPKAKMSPQTSPFQVHGNKMELGPKGISPKHALRHRRAEAGRKSLITMRSQKILEKKREARNRGDTRQ